jgi:hypothetical protein
MAPNAVRVLHRLGFAEGLDREGVRPRFTHQRFRIAQVPVGQQHAGRNGLALLCDTGPYKIRIGRCGASEDLAGGTGGG